MRTFDPTVINRVANLPDVRPLLGGEGPIDVTSALRNPRNYAFCDETGGFLAQNVEGTTYEVHTIFDPALRNFASVIKLAHSAQEYMFIATDCTTLITRVPHGNRGAEILARKGGFREAGVQENWAPGVSASVKTLHLDAWVGVCYGLDQTGRAFLSQLEQAKTANGSLLAMGNVSEVQTRTIGAMIRMIGAGNVVKGVQHYNSWAALYMSDPISVLSILPPVISIKNAVIGFSIQPEVTLCH